MSSKTAILDTQREWALGNRAKWIREATWQALAKICISHFPRAQMMAFRREVGPSCSTRRSVLQKMKALHSSAALAVNFFDYWTNGSPDLLLTALGLEIAPTSIEFEAVSRRP